MGIEIGPIELPPGGLQVKLPPFPDDEGVETWLATPTAWADRERIKAGERFRVLRDEWSDELRTRTILELEFVPG
jgi:hypothetical protein